MHNNLSDCIPRHRRYALFPNVLHPKRELLLEPTLEDLYAYEPRLVASDLLSVDIETAFGQITTVGFAPDAEHALCIPFLDRRVPSRNYWKTAQEEMAARLFVKRILEGPTPKLGQSFGNYDSFWFLRKWHIAPRNYREDTKLIHHALYPELPKSLEFMGASYGTQGSWKHWGRKQKVKKDD